MPVERFYTSSDLHRQQHVRLENQEFHHLAHVTRIQVDETVELVNGRGQLAKAIVQQIGKKHADMQVTEVAASSPPMIEVILAQAIPRQNRLDFILEKGTELGMTQLWLYPGKRSERRKFSESQLEHMRAITISAMKQCGSLFLPKVEIKPPLQEWEKPSELCLYGDLSSDARQLRECWQEKTPQKIIVFIGPESGFAPEEEAQLRLWQALGVKLHPNVLRTDTAALVALSLISDALMTR